MARLREVRPIVSVAVMALVFFLTADVRSQSTDCLTAPPSVVPIAYDGIANSPPAANAEPAAQTATTQATQAEIDALKKRIDDLEHRDAAAAARPVQPAAPMPTQPAASKPGKFYKSETLDRGSSLMPLAPAPAGLSSPPAAAAPSSAAAQTISDTTEPSFLTINDFTLAARGAAVMDTTRMNPAASSLFLPSAIPVKGDSFYGLGERASFQGNGSYVGLGWQAQIPDVSTVSGGASVRFVDASSDSGLAVTPQAWLQWERLTFGVFSDSTFTDSAAVPETIDVGGPNARPWFNGSITEFRYAVLQPANMTSDPTGFYGIAGVSVPQVDVYVPTGYATFSRIPDVMATLKYESGDFVQNKCTGASVYREFWHLQLGALVRDLGVDRSDGTASILREEATGWGVQLSGRFMVRHEPCEELYDYAFFSVTGGQGIARYFNDFHLVNPVNDAIFAPPSGSLTALPVFGYFAAYQHDWASHWRSTAVFSHLELNEGNAVIGTASTFPNYRRGDYLSANLMYHFNLCGPNPAPNKDNAEHSLFAGVEYLYGQRESMLGQWGEDQRIMLMVTASK